MTHLCSSLVVPTIFHRSWEALNPNPSFGYCPRAAAVSWRAAEELLAEMLKP